MAYPVWLARKVRKTFRSLGFSIRRIGDDEEWNTASQFQWMGFLAYLKQVSAVAPAHVEFDFKRFIGHAQSQLGQDLVATWLFGNSGFFVEFGAADGKHLSNSFALEKLGWKGILAEPNRSFHTLLQQHRPVTPVETDCVWSSTGMSLEFVETTAGELATLKDFAACDEHDRSDSTTYSVRTISFEDFLTRYNAPQTIHYLSIDTEGSELEILSSLDWSKRRFGFISVEHNFTSNRERIHELLTKNGYQRFGEVFSQFDDWYVHPEALAALRTPA